MATYGVTKTGFVTKTQNEILKSLEDKLRTQVAQDIDLNPDQPLGQILGILSQALANNWEMGNGCYHAFDPDNAFGNGLSDLVQLNQIQRLPATYSTVRLTLKGTSGTTVPSGSICSSEDGQLEVQTINPVTINETGVPVDARMTTVGSISIPANSITKIKTPLFGWDSVNNALDGDAGEEQETDVQLRSRRAASVALSSSSNIDGLYGALFKVPNIKYIKIYENDTQTVDPVTSTAPNSFQCVVDGGLDIDIANAIFNKKPIGILSYGSTTVTINDIAGFPHTVGFTRPTEVPIYVKVSVKAISEPPASLVSDIKQNIIKYATGQLNPDRKYDVADPVPVSQLYTPVNQTSGVEYIESLTAGLSNDSQLPTGLVPITFNQVASFDEANIEVTLV